METFSALLAICAGNSPVTGEFPAQMPVTRSFEVFFDLRLNKRLSKQSWGWWFEAPSCPLWRHCNGILPLLWSFCCWNMMAMIILWEHFVWTYVNSQMENRWPGCFKDRVFCYDYCACIMWPFQFPFPRNPNSSRREQILLLLLIGISIENSIAFALQWTAQNGSWGIGNNLDNDIHVMFVKICIGNTTRIKYMLFSVSKLKFCTWWLIYMYIYINNVKW